MTNSSILLTDDFYNLQKMTYEFKLGDVTAVLMLNRATCGACTSKVKTPMALLIINPDYILSREEKKKSCALCVLVKCHSITMEINSEHWVEFEFQPSEWQGRGKLA